MRKKNYLKDIKHREGHPLFKRGGEEKQRGVYGFLNGGCVLKGRGHKKKERWHTVKKVKRFSRGIMK